MFHRATFRVGRRGDALAAIIKLRDPESKFEKQVNKFIAKYRALGGRRDRFVHDYYAVDNERNLIKQIVITAKSAVVMEFQERTVEEIDAAIAEIQSENRKLAKLMLEMRVGLPKWPRRQFEQSEGLVQTPSRSSDG